MNRKPILVVVVVAALAAVGAYSTGWFHHQTQLQAPHGRGAQHSRRLEVGGASTKSLSGR